MSSRRAQRRSECDGKVVYPDARAARAAARHLGHKREEWLHAYQCGNGHWHIGHPPARTRQSLAAKARNHRENR